MSYTPSDRARQAMATRCRTWRGGDNWTCRESGLSPVDLQEHIAWAWKFG